MLQEASALAPMEDKEIKEQVQARFRRIATAPSSEKKVPIGPESAKNLVRGFSPEVVPKADSPLANNLINVYNKKNEITSLRSQRRENLFLFFRRPPQ